MDERPGLGISPLVLLFVCVAGVVLWALLILAVARLLRLL